MEACLQQVHLQISCQVEKAWCGRDQLEQTEKPGLGQEYTAELDLGPCFCNVLPVSWMGNEEEGHWLSKEPAAEGKVSSGEWGRPGDFPRALAGQIVACEAP